MKIFLTGGTGFIGSHFLKEALNEKIKIIALKRSQRSKTRIIIDQQPEWAIANYQDIKVTDFEKVDVLVHLATHSGNVPYDTLNNCLQWNVIEVLSLFEKAKLAGIKNYLVAGSCFEYGLSSSSYETIPTTAKLEPTNSYAASKAVASISLQQWAREYGLNLEILRVFHVYGEGELEKRFWPSLRKAAFEGKDFPMTFGEQIRDFQPVEKVAKAFLNRTINMTKISNKVKVYNLSTTKPKTILDFATENWLKFKAKGKLLPGTIPYRKGEVMKYIPGNDIIKID